MKKAPDYKNAIEGAADTAHFIGQLPTQQNTVTAEVLRRLLQGERLTSLAGVFEASTTRLGAVVFYLRTAYGWTCDTQDKAAGCKDGRVAWVTEYRLSAAQRIAAMQRPDVVQWCREVREARAKLRTQAAQAQHRAQTLNAARAPFGQSDLFAGGLA